MKKIVLLAAVVAFIAAGSLVFSKQEFMVYCCWKGKCERVTKPTCERRGGHIVENCGQCK